LADENDDTSEGQQTLPMDAAAIAEISAKASAAEARAQATENRMAAMEQQSREAAAAAADPAPQALTHERVQSAVDEGQIGTIHGADLMAEQRVAASETAIEARIMDRIETRERETRIKSDLDSYYELRKDLNNANSADFKAASREYEHLTDKLGQPKTEATQVAAMRTVFGSIEQLRAAQPRPREGFSEVGGGGRPPEDSNTPKMPPELAANEMLRTHYLRQIDSGTYTGLDDPRLLSELTYVDKLQ